MILSHILKFAQPHLGPRERSFSMSNSKACTQVGRARKNESASQLGNYTHGHSFLCLTAS